MQSRPAPQTAILQVAQRSYPAGTCFPHTPWAAADSIQILLASGGVACSASTLGETTEHPGMSVILLGVVGGENFLAPTCRIGN
jgi:hypothetical protein